jgi:hypothetical protein
MLVCFVSGVRWWAHVLTHVTVNWQNIIAKMTAQAINYFLWSSVGAESTQCAHTVLNLKFWMILMMFHVTVRSCCSSLTVIHLLLPVSFSTCALLSGVLLLWICCSLRSPLCCLFHLRIRHAILLYSTASKHLCHKIPQAEFQLLTRFFHSKIALQHRLHFLTTVPVKKSCSTCLYTQ